LDGDKCLGVLECINKYDGIYTKEDEQLIKMMAKLSASVLGNVINLNEQNMQYNKLRHIINVLHNYHNSRAFYKWALLTIEKNLL
jgi:hypothetical protein